MKVIMMTATCIYLPADRKSWPIQMKDGTAFVFEEAADESKYDLGLLGRMTLLSAKSARDKEPATAE
jgi:hypothetical protein